MSSGARGACGDRDQRRSGEDGGRLVPIFRRNYSCGFSMVEFEQSAESFPASDHAIFGRGRRSAIDQGIRQALMISLEMAVSHVFRDGHASTKMSGAPLSLSWQP